jgi:hypothetical protein
MAGYRRLQGLLTALLIAYALGAIAVKLGARRDRELYPLFSWSLFSMVEAEPTEYAVRLVSVGTGAVPAGRFLDQAFEAFTPVRMPAEAWLVTQKLGDALASGDAADLARWRRVLESNFLTGHGPVRYEIVRCHYVTLERAATGAIRSVQTVATFTAAG